MPTLAETCIPRKSVFDRARRDTVLNLSDLLQNRLDIDYARQFFEENYITAGMKVLIQKSFDRLSGKQDQPSAYLLSQAMGGGKTHSMIALGLLARYPEIRHRLGTDFQLGNEVYTVIGFDGRESDYPFGLWGALADQLGQKDLFASLYTPLQAPGVTSWVHLLKNKSVIILLDELPPYFNNARSIQIGSSNLAEVTATALSNLLVAANREELSRVVIVISDLSSTAYTDGSLLINQALENFRQETQRNVVPIEPVATQGDEIFHILRTRLFETLPDNAVRDAIAVAYAKSVEQARQMDLTAETPASFASQIRESYPFHYALRDLYGRFKANPGFQQTRGLLRLMRAVTANLWESGKAQRLELIHPYDIDLNVQEIFNEFSTINPTLTEAIRVDIANFGASHAEQLDAKLGGESQAQDAAKLLYVASLSTAQNPELGLHDGELIAWLCRPGRDVSRMKTDVLEQLPASAWYLHVSNDGRLYFKNVRNLAATLHSYVESYNRETKIKELREYLVSLFKPIRGDVYQECLVLPNWEEAQPGIEKTVLIVTDPFSVTGTSQQIPLHQEWIHFYENLEYKNRVLFLTGDRDTMEEVLKNAALLKAIRTILAEQESEHLSERDPQRIEANRSRDRILLSLRSAIQQTFSMVLYPGRSGLRKEEIKFVFDANSFNGEDQIREALKQCQKFSDGSGNIESWISKIEDRLFDNQNPVRWRDIKARAATKPDWPLHLPRFLDDVKNQALRLGKWREEGDLIRKGPFPKEPSTVSIIVKNRDETTGVTVLDIRPVGGTKVVYEIGDGEPTTTSEVVPNYSAFETKDLRLTFKCIDENDPGRKSKIVRWTNKITLQSRVFEQAGERYIELLAIPPVPIYYTTDGTDPRIHGVSYEGPFPIPSGCRVIQAIGKKDDIESDLLTRDIQQITNRSVDPARSLIWKTKRFINLTTNDAWELISRMEEFNAIGEGITLYLEFPETGGEEFNYTAPPGIKKSGVELRKILEMIGSYGDTPNITLSLHQLHFERGQGFLDWVNKYRIAYDFDREVHQ
ncbi:DUF499 domain-containing protein [Treponema sp. J25]|uniref:DUF499 domain-containing protein n=1 Tax=Treponema sp. J25 TaxID=2094121 RepID=UPI001051D5EB|nr:DUF499 domain-containing protein [Treponema sp. J25]TCW60564.1 glycosyl transferase [Treponema sp. J25]